MSTETSTNGTAAAPASVAELVDRYAAAWNAHDLDAVMALHAEDSEFVMHQAGSPPPAVGNEAVREMFDFLLKAWPARFDAQDLIVKENLYVCRMTVTATLGLPWPFGDVSLAPNGKEVTFGLLDVVTTEGNLVKRKESWTDPVGMSRSTVSPIG